MNEDTLLRAHNARLCVIGDIMLDHYIMGEATRISPEAPIPIVLVDQDLYTPGGAANVAANVSSLGANCLLFGVVGRDSNGDRLIDLLKSKNVDTSYVYNDIDANSRPTTTKTRVVAGIQQIVRFDRENTIKVDSSVKVIILERIKELVKLGKIDGIIIEDYAKGLLDTTFSQSVINVAFDYGIPVALDPNPKNPMSIEGLTTMTPNRHEAYKLANVEEVHSCAHKHPLDDSLLRRVGEKLLQKYRMEFLIITLGKDGLIIYSKDSESPCYMPTRAIEVFDVSGAGDTFISVFTTYYSKIRDVKVCAEIANIAAGIVVGKRGAATVTIKEIEKRAKES